MKNMRKLIGVILLFITLTSFADQIATTDDGRKVLLKDNGTWEYVETSEGMLVSITDWNVVRLTEDYDVGRYSDEARLTLSVKNETDKLIKGWRLFIEVRNAFGDLMGKLTLTGGQSRIEPGQTINATFAFEDNQFLDGEPFDYLTSYNKDTMTIDLVEAKVIQ